jgi:hypothetical protein
MVMMKHVTGSRRGRNRGSGKRHPLSKNHTFESNGPDGKIRGTAQQVLDKYLALGRDATSSGDPISAEGFFQHAEHYHRVLHANDGNDGNGGERGQDRGRRFPVSGDTEAEGGDVDAASADQPAEGADRFPN